MTLFRSSAYRPVCQWAVTFLLTRLWTRERAFYFTASATSPEINRKVLVEEAARWSGKELRSEDYPTWRSLLRMLLELRPEQDIVVILDEFQYRRATLKGWLKSPAN